MIEHIIALAKTAGAAIMEIYNSNDFAASIKQDHSPLTRADIASNEIIIDGLKRIADYPAVSEETEVEYKSRKDWSTFWLVDPLDGTKDFIAKNGQFTVNIALIQGKQPVLGVIYLPAQDTAYWAEQGTGAYKEGKKIYNTSQRTDLIASDSVFHSSSETVLFLERNHITQIKKYGSSIKYCKLAEGEIDIYPRYNGTKEWDTAAGQILLQEAGCKMIDITTGEPLVYNKPDMKNNHFIAMRNGLGMGLLKT